MRQIAKIVLINVAMLLILIFLIEGFSSFYYSGLRIYSKGPIAERKHTEYDEELGWVNLPNIFVENMYGPGVYLEINSQRHRNHNVFSLKVPRQKIRIICSGDSFTLGYGVDNDHTWCQLLTSVHTKLETVNLGQGGYGVDQAFLWYQRNEQKLDHDIQVFAFITDDFKRMKSDSFLGYGKPFLSIRDESLYQMNNPVPKRSYYAPYLTTVLTGMRELRTFRLLRGVVSPSDAQDTSQLDTNSDIHTQDVVSRIFSQLQRQNREKQSILVLVYLPRFDDYMGNAETDSWRDFVRKEADENGYMYVDLVRELQSLPPQSIRSLFDGHYSVEGNEFIANTLFAKLKEMPAVADKLGQQDETK